MANASARNGSGKSSAKERAHFPHDRLVNSPAERRTAVPLEEQRDRRPLLLLLIDASQFHCQRLRTERFQDMSAVENVDARIARLQLSLDAKCTELHVLQTRHRYNPEFGVDEDIVTGRSVAMLEVKIVGGRNMLYKSGFLAGKTTYVRAWLEPREVSQNGEKQSTNKRDIQSTPCWQESFCFQSVAHVGAILMVEVMQEERIGNDLLVGSVQLPLAALQDQRLLERWHVLSKDNQASASELLLSCRFNRSRISAVELDIELLQNQLRELHNFVERQRQFSPQPFSASARFVPRNPLIGREVVLQTSVQRSYSSRFNAVATFPLQPAAVAARKREHVEFAHASPSSSTSGDAAIELPRAKRQRVFANEPTATPLSFTDKLANWLLPSKPAPIVQGFGSAAVSDATTPASYPFKQQQQPQSADKRRAKRNVSARPRLQKSPSVLQSFNQWLFTEPENKAPN